MSLQGGHHTLIMTYVNTGVRQPNSGLDWLDRGEVRRAEPGVGESRVGQTLGGYERTKQCSDLDTFGFIERAFPPDVELRGEDRVGLGRTFREFEDAAASQELGNPLPADARPYRVSGTATSRETEASGISIPTPSLRSAPGTRRRGVVPWTGTLFLRGTRRGGRG